MTSQVLIVGPQSGLTGVSGSFSLAARSWNQQRGFTLDSMAVHLTTFAEARRMPFNDAQLDTPDASPETLALSGDGSQAQRRLMSLTVLSLNPPSLSERIVGWRERIVWVSKSRPKGPSTSAAASTSPSAVTGDTTVGANGSSGSPGGLCAMAGKIDALSSCSPARSNSFWSAVTQPRFLSATISDTW
jgi:hypothetical protein